MKIFLTIHYDTYLGILPKYVPSYVIWGISERFEKI